MYRRRVVYHPQYVRGFSAAMLRARRDLARLREDWLLEAAQIREEIREAKAELRRLQQLDQAQRTERDDFGMLLQ
jgi:hypothetical protein